MRLNLWKWKGWPLLAVFGMGLWLYWPSLELLLFWDDVPHMFWLASQKHGSYWLSAEGFPFYRPSTFAVWDLLYRLFGYHQPVVLHAVSVGLHMANAGLVAALGMRFGSSRRVGWWAGLIFVAFPFSYQTIIPTAAHFHLWLVFGLLSSAWLLLDWLENGGAWRLGMAWVAVFWAIFSHENGVLAPVLLAGLLGVAEYQRSRDWRRWKWQNLLLALMPVGVMAGVYGGLWLFLPKANESNGLILSAMEVKLGQTWQAIGFPLAALLQRLDVLQSATLGAWISGVVVVVIVALSSLGKKPLRWGWLGALGWIGLVMLPAWLMLDVNYLLGSPRLHYLAAVGIAWLWAWGLEAVGQRSPRGAWSVGLVGTGLCLVVAVPFIRLRITEHQAIDGIYRQAAAALVTKDDTAARVLLINGPAYLAERQPFFLLGAEGSTYLPDFVEWRDWLRLNRLGNPAWADNRHVVDISPETEHWRFAVNHPLLDKTSLSDYERVAVVMRWGDGFRPVVVGEQFSQAIWDGEILGDFGNGVRLDAASLRLDENLPHTLRLELMWEVERPLEAAVGVFVHFRCEGQLVGQADGPPLGRVYPFELWGAGERWLDRRYLALEAGQISGCLEALVGLYDPISGERLSIGEADGVVVRLELR